MDEITLFYATDNKNKLHNMYYRLKDFPIRILSPKDLGIHLDIEENGNTVVENALIKANEYYKVVNMPTIAGDSGMHIDGLSEDKQPGLYVRRVNGKVLTDDEMIDYYSKLAQTTTEDCYIRYFTGIALVTNQGTFTLEINDTPLLLATKANTNRKHNGNPLDIVSVIEDGRYFNDLSDEERVALDQKGEQLFTDFIVNNLSKI